MKNAPTNPVHWRLDTLLSLGNEEVHQLAKSAAGTLTSYRLVLGRCLLALHHNRGFRQHGCSSAVHYATSVLGISVREARSCKRVAGLLLHLPDLTLAAELGQIAWSKLREITRTATAQTEAFWLKLASTHSYREVEVLVRRTPKGAVPGEVETDDSSCSHELRCSLSEEVFVMLDHARRMFSLEMGEAVTSAQVVEMALASYIASQPADSETLEQVREETDKDIQAERARQLPIVQKARELAAEMGALDSGEDGSVNDGVLEAEPGCALETALGSVPLIEVKVETPVVSKKHARVGLGSSTWQNTRLKFNPQNRHTTKAQRKELLRRDGWCCNTPGCPNKVWLHLHHLDPYAKGGATEPSNLICLCAGCHRNLHRGHLRIVPDQNGHLVYTNRQGLRLDRQANLERAGWLNFWLGWNGNESDCHRSRAG